MQPATNSAPPAEDLHSILSRFQAWAGKQPDSHNGHKQNPQGVREIPMEEAIRQLRSRSRSAAPASVPEKPRVTESSAPAVALPVKPEIAPRAAPPVTQAVASPARATDISVSAAEAKPTAAKQPSRRVRALTPHGAKAARLAAASRRKPVPWLRKAKAEPVAIPAKKKSVPRRSQARKTAKETTKAKPVRSKAAKPTKQLRRAKKAKAPAHETARKPPRRTAQKRGKPEFREVLARSVRPDKPRKRPERRQRVSVRLSSAEQRRLQQCAAREGLTVSEYLRQSALHAEAPRAEFGIGTTTRAHGARPTPPGQLFTSSAAQNSSILGGWLALLRNRFLASPTRFAERA